MANYYGKCGWYSDAASMWAKEYARLSNAKPGMAGAVSSRAEAQALRLSLIYAILDGSNNIDVPHIKAAMEVWRYCQDSVDYCFGGKSNDPMADAILDLLTRTMEGASLTQISHHFGKNKKSDEIQRALAVLSGMGKARSEQRKTNSRAAEVWFAV